MSLCAYALVHITHVIERACQPKTKNMFWLIIEMVSYVQYMHILQMFTFIFIWPLLWAPSHGDSAFIKYEKWPYKSKEKRTHHSFYMAIPRHTTESVE